MQPTTFIYALKDPETGECRYVGKTNDLKKTYCRHIRDGRTKSYHKAYWIKSLLVRGLRPLIEIIDEVTDEDSEGFPLEAAYIQFFREEGFDLTNITPGGDAGPDMTGTKHTPETIKKMCEDRAGDKNPNFGKPVSAERKEKIRDTMTGRKLSPAHVANMRGKEVTPATRAKMRVKKPGASSGFYGVFRHTDRNKWGASIKVEGKRKNLGRFENEVEAAEVYDIAAKIHHGAYAVLNFPD